MAINSRNKGSRGEKLAIQCLTKWSGLKFVRVPLSGGLRWKNTTNTCGDIIADEPNYILPISIEAKFVKEINFEHLVYHRGTKARKTAKIKEFWKQCTSDAKRGKKIPFLMMRYNGMPKDVFFVAMGYNDFNALGIPDLQPRLQFDKKIFITTTRALSQHIKWKEFEAIMLQRLRTKYG